MNLDKKQLRAIYDKNKGYCHICESKLAFTNYGKNGTKGSWHVDHSKAKASGGSDYFRNLQPCCISCNLNKGTQSGPNYKKKFEPKTIGGKIVDALGLEKGTLGASRKRVRRKK